MTWGLFTLLLILFICFSVLVYINFKDSNGFFETYFLIVIITLFVILLFTIDFSIANSITYTFKNRTTATSFVLDVPYNDDTSYSNIMSVSFAGTWNIPTTPVNNSPSNDSKIFNYDSITAPVSLLDGKIVLTKLPNWQLRVDVDPNVGGNVAPINGYFNLTLLCNSSQDINGKFQEV